MPVIFLLHFQVAPLRASSPQGSNCYLYTVSGPPEVSRPVSASKSRFLTSTSPFPLGNRSFWSRSSEQNTYVFALFPLYVRKIGFRQKINGFYSWGFLVRPILANRLCRALLVTSRKGICTVSAVIPRTCYVACLTLRERIDQANRQR